MASKHDERIALYAASLDIQDKVDKLEAENRRLEETVKKYMRECLQLSKALHRATGRDFDTFEKLQAEYSRMRKALEEISELESEEGPWGDCSGCINNATRISMQVLEADR